MTPHRKASRRPEVSLADSLADVGAFSRRWLPDYALRAYQVEPARAIVDSVEQRRGRSLAMVFSRQSGKDELLAQVLAYLLTTYQTRGGSIVVAAPSFRPQAALSRDRLLDRLAMMGAAATADVRDGYVVRFGRAAARFLSAAPVANARGQTADLLLVANEAQDIQPAVWDAVFDPMAASTNATTLFMGTVWSQDTLLARQLRYLEGLERRDGERRVWRVPWDQVARELPAYGERVRSRIEQLGIAHPFVQTEYFLVELDGAGSLFPPHRLAQLQGDHRRRHRADPDALRAGRRYALLLDVAGEEEAGTGPAAFNDADRRDSTALTVVEIEPGQRPGYRVVDRMAWTRVKHVALHAQLVDLARHVWRASMVVVDATGIGAGLASFLAAALGDRRSGAAIPVLPFVFSRASKSALGWDFVALIDAGRFKEYADDGDQLSRLFRSQLAATSFDAPPGPGKVLQWSVPAGRGHDDLVMSAALAALLDGVDWRPRVARGTGETEPGRDTGHRRAGPGAWG